MDKQLLKALDNLSTSLEKIAEILGNKKAEPKSDVTKALQGGNFIEEIKEINIGVKEIRKDTQEILKQQKTILEMSKKKESDKKTESLETDPKKESSIKKGVASILLIAVAVLAIGMAFKIVGKVDFISVIGLGLAIVLISMAFERVAKLGLTKKQAADVSLAMVIMSAGVFASSLILSNVAKVGFAQMMSIVFIGLALYFLVPVMGSMIAALKTKKKIKTADGKEIETEAIEWGTLIKTAVALPLVLLGFSIGVMLASKFLAMVSPVGLPQALSTILISVTFAIAAGGLVRIISVFNKEKISWGDALKSAFLLPIVMVGFALGIWFSSMILNKVQPIGLMQAITSILIAAVFVVISFGLKKIIGSFSGISPAQAIMASLLLPLALPAMSLAIWLSSIFLNKVQKISTDAFIGSLMISAIFLVISFSMKKIAAGISAMQWSSVPKIPVFFVLISAAIAASAFIFFKAQPYFQIEWMTMVKILALGAIIGVLGVIFGYATKTIGNISWANVIKLPIFFTLITLSIAASAFILHKSQAYFQIEWMTMLKILALGVVLGIIGIVFGIASKIIGNISWANVIKLPIFFTLITLAVAISAWILSKFVKSFDAITFTMLFKILVFGVVLAITTLLIGVVMRILTIIGGIQTYAEGALVILLIATVVMLSSKILNYGDYKNYPSLRWVLGVGAGLAAFGLAAAVLGLAVFGPQALIFAAGLAAILVVAATIVETSKIIQKGKYQVPGLLNWAVAVSLLYATFTPIIIALGALGLAGGVLKFFGADDPFEKAKGMMVQIAQTIVDVAGILAKGKFVGGPNVQWASGISIALGAFSPLYAMLMANGVAKIFGGGGIGPDDFAKAIRTVSEGIMYAAVLFASPLNKGVWKGGPPKTWAEGVGTAIGAFAPVFSILTQGSLLSVFGGKGVDAAAMRGAIVSIAGGIVDAAKFFADPNMKLAFTENYPKKEWGEGVGAALAAFAPVFAALSGKGWFSSGEEVIADMKNGIIQIADAIVKVANKLAGEGKVKPDWTKYPSKEWADGISNAVMKFSALFTQLNKQKGGMAVLMMNSTILSFIVKSMVDTSVLISRGKFDKSISPEWIDNLQTSMLKYMMLNNKLNVAGIFQSRLFSNKEIQDSIKGSFSGDSKADMIATVAGRMAKTATIIYSSWKRKIFTIQAMKEVESWTRFLRSSLSMYVWLERDLKKELGTTKITTTEKSLWTGDKKITSKEVANDPSTILNTTISLVKVAGILWESRKFFQFKIDPKYMSGVAANLMIIAKLSKEFAKTTGGGGGFMNRLLGNDPVSIMAGGMSKLARAWDELAISLRKFGDSVKTIDSDKLSIIRRLTGNIALLSTMDADMFSRMMSVLESKASVFSKLLEPDKKTGTSVGGAKGAKGGAAVEVGMVKKKDTSKQLDEIITVLKQISYNTSGLDDYLATLGIQSDKKAKL
jgi:hypothetical protein